MSVVGPLSEPVAMILTRKVIRDLTLSTLQCCSLQCCSFDGALAWLVAVPVQSFGDCVDATWTFGMLHFPTRFSALVENRTDDAKAWLVAVPMQGCGHWLFGTWTFGDKNSYWLESEMVACTLSALRRPPLLVFPPFSPLLVRALRAAIEYWYHWSLVEQNSFPRD